MAQKPSIPKGTRDFSTEIMRKRNYIFNHIKNVFTLFGYEQIETPAIENLSTLMGKYGEEGDRLLFKILNSGDFLSKVDGNYDYKKMLPKITEKGLRYDLTVPFARYVVQHRNEIKFPFKRYQIQPVWRADKPQKGRYREFFQCDVDVVGSNSLLYETEMLQIIDRVFQKLELAVVTKINNRKILYGIAEYIGETEKFVTIITIIDKLEKIGLGGVKNELKAIGLSQEKTDKVISIISLSGSNDEKIEALKKMFKDDSETGMKGVEEMEKILENNYALQFQNEIDFDISLARGLNYYTGCIFEVKAKDVNIGSICGGGRYDNLTGLFGLNDLSGVGISFGADRVYDVMTELSLFPEEFTDTLQVLFINFGEKEMKYCLTLAQKLRNENISCEVYPEAVKMKKQMSFANNRKVKYVAFVGEDEMKTGEIVLKNMQSGEQKKLRLDELLSNLL